MAEDKVAGVTYVEDPTAMSGEDALAAHQKGGTRGQGTIGWICFEAMDNGGVGLFATCQGDTLDQLYAVLEADFDTNVRYVCVNFIAQDCKGAVVRVSNKRGWFSVVGKKPVKAIKKGKFTLLTNFKAWAGLPEHQLASVTTLEGIKSELSAEGLVKEFIASGGAHKPNMFWIGDLKINLDDKFTITETEKADIVSWDLLD